MHEDDLYRQSSQYRLWSYTPEKLAALRDGTNTLAAARVKEALRRVHNNGAVMGKEVVSADGDVECLSVQEEKIIVQYYCSQAIHISTNDKGFGFPPDVIASAVQFLKRFYLTNSPMTYHPRDIMITALFFVTKTEPYYTSLDKFVTIMQGNVSKKRSISAETVLAPEFILTQGLRFTFDVKHPYRALRGIHVELLSLANGSAMLAAHEARSPSQLRQELRALKLATGSTAPVIQRLNNAYAKASECLKKAAILTDAYFLYTPSQIAFAALMLGDEPLMTFYLATKFSSSAESLHIKAMATMRECAEMLHKGPEYESLTRDELIRIDKKLYKCQNPEKMDLVGLNQAAKRDHSVDGKLDSEQAKKRKLDREKSMKEGEDLFGPNLQTYEMKNAG